MFQLTGKTIGSYRVLEQIGVGGMAMVYKAYHPGMDRYVAIKVLPPHLSQDPDFLKRFQREARAIAKLEHAHILPVHDYGEYEGITYLAMRYVEAGTLKDRITAKRFSLDEINRIISQIGGALDYAHRMGVIHRDVKPGNVLVDEQGDTYLTDFGLARMMEPTEKLTASGVGLGTPAYMSPEQGQGDKVDHRSDIYSLGVILYEMVTGHVPYEAETPMAIVLKHINDELPLPRTIAPSVPPSIERVILKALAKAPSDRYQTAGELVQALVKATSEAGVKPEMEPIPTQVNPAPAREDISLVTRLQQTWERPRGKITLIGGGLFIIVVLGFLLTWLLPDPIAIVEHGELMTATTIVQAASTPTIIVVRPTQTAISTRTPIPTVTPILPGAILYDEDFEDGKADGLTSTGAYWKVVSDDDGNKVYEVDTTPDVSGSTIEFGSSSWTDYAIEYRVKMLNPEADIWVNFRNSNQGSYIQRLSLRYGTVDLYSNLSENPWQPLAEPNYNVIQGVWYLVRIEAQGETLRVFVNGELKIERTDSKISAGNIAIGNLGNTHAQFDDIRVTTIESTIDMPSLGTALYDEDFEDGKADGLLYIGEEWKVVDDEKGNKVYEMVNGGGIGIGSETWTDYVLEYRLRILDGDRAGSSVRNTNGTQSHSSQILSSTYNSVELAIVPLGDPPQAFSKDFNIQKNIWYQVRVEAEGESIRVYIDGKLVVEASDPRIRAGHINLGGDARAQFDDIRVTALTTDTALSACVAVPDGLVGWWPGNGDTQDVAGGNNGELHGNASFAPGKVGQAFSFDGIDGSVNVPNSPSLDVRGQVSIEFWMKPAPGNTMNDCCQGLVTTDHYLIEISGNPNSPNPPSPVGVDFIIKGNNRTKQTAEEFDKSFKVPMDIWSYIVGTYDGKWLRLYVDGKQENQVLLTGDIPSMITNSFLSIGSEDGMKDCGNCAGRYFEGLIDEVSVYDRALTADEVLSIYSVGESGKCSVIK